MPKYECREPGCTSYAKNGGVCIRHGAKVKQCSKEECTNQVVKGGVCIRHGAKVQQCSKDGCTNRAVKGGVCMRHGAKLKRCSKEGCTKFAQNGGVCRKHGAERYLCSKEGCTNKAQKGGLCVKHGAKVKRCSKEGCTNQVVKGGVCRKHGAEVKRCSRTGCTNKALKGGVCKQHGAKTKQCSHEGCTNQVYSGGVCVKHGAKVKICSKDGCTKYAQKGGVCRKHGAKVKIYQCSSEGCTNQAIRGGVCRKHGAKLKRCSSEGCTNKVVKGGVCRRHGAERYLCSHDGCTNQARNGGVCMKHGAKVKRCSKDGCTNKARNGGVCWRHGANKLRQNAPEKEIEEDEGDEEITRQPTETAVEMCGNESITGESAAAAAVEEEAPEQAAETSQRPSDLEDDWGGNNDSGTMGDLAETMEETVVEPPQLPSGTEEETTESREQREFAAVGDSWHEDRLQSAPAEEETGGLAPLLRGADDSGAMPSGESSAVGAGSDWQSEVGFLDKSLDGLGDLDRSKRTNEGDDEFSSSKRQRTERIDSQNSSPSNATQLDTNAEIARLKAALVERAQDIRALQMKLSRSEKLNSDLENKKAELEEEVRTLKDSLNKATETQSDDGPCSVCCGEYKVTCPRCSYTMCRSCVVIQHLNTRHEYDTEAGYGVFEQDPTKCPGCNLKNAFALEDTEKPAVERAKQGSNGRSRSRGQQRAGDRERADENESIAYDDDDDDIDIDNYRDDDSSSDYQE